MKEQIILSPALDIYLQIKGLKTSFLERTSIYHGTSPFEHIYLSAVGLAFLWGDTPEGYSYWNEISEEFEHTVILDVDQLYIQGTYIIVTTEEQLNDCLKFFILLNRTWNNGEKYTSQSMLTILLSSLKEDRHIGLCPSQGYWANKDELHPADHDILNYDEIILSRKA